MTSLVGTCGTTAWILSFDPTCTGRGRLESNSLESQVWLENMEKSSIPRGSISPISARFRPGVVALVIAALIGVSGCGGHSTSSAPGLPASPAAQNADVTGQYNMVLTSTSARGPTNIYTDFTQTGNTLLGAVGTLVCPFNDLSQCQGGDTPITSITANGTVNGSNITIVISFPSVVGADTVSLVGTAVASKLAGTYTDSLGDAGTWTASSAIHPLNPFPGVYDYSGTFNSTSNPLLIAPTLLIELGRDASSNASFDVTGMATIMNSPCISSLSLSGRAIGDALVLTDTMSKAMIIALPTQPTVRIGSSFTFSYKFESTAARCAGDSGRGAMTIVPSSFDY